MGGNHFGLFSAEGQRFEGICSFRILWGSLKKSTIWSHLKEKNTSMNNNKTFYSVSKYRYLCERLLHFVTKTFTLMEFQCINYTVHECGGKSGCTLCSHSILMTAGPSPSVVPSVPVEHRAVWLASTFPAVHLCVMLHHSSSTIRLQTGLKRSFNSFNFVWIG